MKNNKRQNTIILIIPR